MAQQSVTQQMAGRWQCAAKSGGEASIGAAALSCNLWQQQHSRELALVPRRSSHCRAAYHGVLLVYALACCGALIPLQLWLMPNEPFTVGEVRARLHCCQPRDEHRFRAQRALRVA